MITLPLFLYSFEDMLKIPFRTQKNDWACGAAVLEMLFLYFNKKDINQTELFNLLKEGDGHEKDGYRISTSNLANVLEKENLKTVIAKTFLDECNVKNILNFYINEIQIPIVVCQQASKKDLLSGHFRIVTGFDGRFVYANDPDLKNGGKDKKFLLKEFISLWKETGKNVTGGVYFWCSK